MADDLKFQETAPQVYAGVVQAVEPGSLAAALGLRAGDEVTAVNGQPVEDVIDVQFYAAEDEVRIDFRRDNQLSSAVHRRSSGQALGLEFVHPTFDIDIRRCNNLCPFCFVLQTAPRMRRTLYIKDDDYRYSFLYGHFVTLTNLTEHDWARIAEQRLSPLYVSVHSTDLANRRACLANPKAPDILEQLRWLAERRIEVHTQLVVTPGLNDGPYLEKSVRDLMAFYPVVQSVSVVPVGLTKHHKYGRRVHTVEEARAILKAVAGWQQDCLAQFGARFVYPTDEWFLQTGSRLPAKKYYEDVALQENGLGQVRDFLEEWRRSKRELKALINNHSITNYQSPNHPITQSPNQKFQLTNRRATLITAALFAPTLAKAAAEFDALAGTRLSVIPVLNERLGHTITVAGLLMGQDVIDQLRGRDLGECVVLPRVMFDHPDGISLDDVAPLTIAQALGRPVFLADALGDVLDAFTGRNGMAFDPAHPEAAPRPMKAGGWAVEKYL